MFNDMMNRQEYLPTGNEAHIKVIPKPGRDPKLPNSYRPFSLINIDAKLLSHILAERISQFLPEIIHPVQAGFTKSRSPVLNIRTIAVVEHAKANPHNNISILTLDAEKAFDNVNIEWLFKTMEHMGISGPYLKLIKSMYKNPKARILTPGHLSKPFQLFRGTRQGCPLSPILFNLALESLARHILVNPDIKGVQIGRLEIKLSMFADDVLMYITDTTQTLQKIQKLL